MKKILYTTLVCLLALTACQDEPKSDEGAVEKITVNGVSFNMVKVEGGSVNISDVTSLIDYLLSGNASGINVTAADCNQDSLVNISDVTALIDYLLSGTW